jgi:hypothetical protein
MGIKIYFEKAIKWNSSSDAEHPWCTTLEGKKARIRINDFPAEALYTLEVDGSEADFDEWPSGWVKLSPEREKRASFNGSTRQKLVKA